MGRQNESVNLVRQGVGPPGECVWEWEREGRAGRGLFSAIPRRSRRPERELAPDYTETDTLLRDTKRHRPKSRSQRPSDYCSSSCNAAAACGERGLEGRGRRSV
jgi:hypothetical protein